MHDSSVRHGYAIWARCYDEDGNPLIAIEGPDIEARLGSIAGRRTLDLGCGTGRHTLALAKRNAYVVAVDFVPEMLDRARAKLAGYRVDWVRHALPSPLPFATASFDLVVIGLVAEHIDDWETAMNEASRTLSRRGRCLLSTLHPERTEAGDQARYIDTISGERRSIHTVHRTIDEYLEIAAAAGLALVDQRSLFVDQDLAARLPRAVKYLGKPLGWVAEWIKD